MRVSSPHVHGMIGRLLNRPAVAVRTGSSMQGGFAVVAKRATARAAVAATATAGLESGSRPATGTVARGHKGPGQPSGDGGAGMAWSQLQVGCNVSVAGSDRDGAAWWRFHCGLISTAGNSLRAPAQPQPAHATTAGQRHTSQVHSGRPQQQPQQQQPASHSNGRQAGLSRARPSSPKPPKPSQQGPGRGVTQDPDPAQGSGYATCGPAVQGPLLVVVLERVQSGLLGAALSAFGITGLYFSVVFGRCCILGSGSRRGCYSRNVTAPWHRCCSTALAIDSLAGNPPQELHMWTVLPRLWQIRGSQPCVLFILLLPFLPAILPRAVPPPANSAAVGIGRFLRLTVSNIRLRIAYEDFPSTQRLVAMVQVGVLCLGQPRPLLRRGIINVSAAATSCSLLLWPSTASTPQSVWRRWQRFQLAGSVFSSKAANSAILNIFQSLHRACNG